jgi:hypothetical protein
MSIDSLVSLITTENRGFNVAVELNVTLPRIEDRVRAADRVASRPSGMPTLERRARQCGVTLTAGSGPGS